MVLSTISGMLCFLAIAEMPAMSTTTPPGLAMDSMKIALVFGVTAAANASRSSESAQITFQPKFL